MKKQTKKGKSDGDQIQSHIDATTKNLSAAKFYFRETEKLQKFHRSRFPDSKLNPFTNKHYD